MPIGLVDGRQMGIAIHLQVHLGQIKPVRKWPEQGKDLATADHLDFRFLGTERQRFADTLNDVGPLRHIAGLAGDDNVAAAR